MCVTVELHVLSRHEDGDRLRLWPGVAFDPEQNIMEPTDELGYTKDGIHRGAFQLE